MGRTMRRGEAGRRIVVPAIGIVAAMLAGPPARACDDRSAEVPAAIVFAADSPAAPAAPEAPAAPRGRTPESVPAPTAAPTAVPAPPLEQPEAPRRLLPRAWFGFGLQCDDCSASSREGDSTVVWAFASWPRVYSVEPGAPAARAGIQRGDVITHINGISLLTPRGGRMFGATRPGQVVRWTLLRAGKPKLVLARAEERPERRLRIADMQERMKQLNEMQDMQHLREEMARINARIERLSVEGAQAPMQILQPQTIRALRYAGVIGGAEVEVRGPGTVIVSENDSKDEVVINTGESVIVIRASDLAKALERAKELDKRRERPK